MVGIGLMIPLRRCGSNAIRLRLAENPDIFCPYPIHLIDLDETKYGDLENDKHYFSLIVDILHLQATSLIPWKGIEPFDPHLIFQRVKDKNPRCKQTVYYEILHLAGKHKNVHFVMDKSQDSVEDWSIFIRLNPHFKFLDVVRDPRAQISSMNEAVIYDYETSLNTQRWLRGRRLVDEIREEYPQNILTIRFEDFILEEMLTMKKICQFFGIGYRETNILHSEEASRMAVRSPLWEKNHSNGDPTVFEKYKRLLTRSEIEHIETNTMMYMKKYGYKKETPARELLTISKEEKERRNQQKRDFIWKQLKEKHPFDYLLRKKRRRFLENC
jgi:hypothetical protein